MGTPEQDRNELDKAVAARPRQRGWFRSALGFLLVYLIAVVLVSALAWCIWVYVQIERAAYEDQAVPADVICVFGAAE